MGKTATLHLRIDEDVKDELSQIAEHENRSMSSIAEQAIKDRIEFEHAQVRAIQEGLAQAERGEVIPHEEVKAWVESWDTDNELPKPTSKTSV